MVALGYNPSVNVKPRCAFQDNWDKQAKGKYDKAYEDALEAAGVESSGESYEQYYGEASGGSPRVNTPTPRPPDHSVSPAPPSQPDSQGGVTPPIEMPASTPSWKVRRERREEREREALDERVREAGKRNKHRKNAPTEWEATAGQERTAVMGIIGGRKR